ncbi:MAG: prephenate dehydratase [Frankiales bacterium]|nr:prephenate dehydratase [Frankiales bacterium]
MTLRYGFLGPEGTFAHAAARRLAGVESGDVVLVPLPGVTQAIDAVRAGAVDGALVPLENSVEGGVPATLDELVADPPLIITAEVFLPVVFDLLVRPGAELINVKTLATHPHAEAQVRRYLMTELPTAAVTMVSSTAGGAKLVADGEFDAAVAPPIAGELYGLEAAAHDIADRPGAVTRFVLLTPPSSPPPATGNDRTSLVTFLSENRSGALIELLSELSTRGVNLTRLESRPTKASLGEYCFFIDCEGHIADQRVGDALAALHRVCADVRYLGSYPRTDGEQGPVLEGRSDEAFVDAAHWLAAIRSDGTS